jgi:hypothetical protein
VKNKFFHPVIDQGIELYKDRKIGNIKTFEKFRGKNYQMGIDTIKSFEEKEAKKGILPPKKNI